MLGVSGLAHITACGAVGYHLLWHRILWHVLQQRWWRRLVDLELYATARYSI